MAKAKNSLNKMKQNGKEFKPNQANLKDAKSVNIVSNSAIKKKKKNKTNVPPVVMKNQASPQKKNVDLLDNVITPKGKKEKPQKTNVTPVPVPPKVTPSKQQKMKSTPVPVKVTPSKQQKLNSTPVPVPVKVTPNKQQKTNNTPAKITPNKQQKTNTTPVVAPVKVSPSKQQKKKHENSIKVKEEDFIKLEKIKVEVDSEDEEESDVEMASDESEDSPMNGTNGNVEDSEDEDSEEEDSEEEDSDEEESEDQDSNEEEDDNSIENNEKDDNLKGNTEEDDNSEENDEQEDSEKGNDKQVKNGESKTADPEKKIEMFHEKSIFVGNVLLGTTEKELKALFSKYGTIESLRFRGVPVSDPYLPRKVAIIRNKIHPGASTCFAYIRFEKKEQAQAALAANGTEFKGLHIRVDTSIPKTPDTNKAIFVGNLPYTAQEEDLRELFIPCGAIESIRVVRNKLNVVGIGMAYVNFVEADSVQLALQLGDVVLNGRTLRIAPHANGNRNRLPTNVVGLRDFGDCSDIELKKAFEVFGRIDEISVSRRGDSSNARITYSTCESAKEALKNAEVKVGDNAVIIYLPSISDTQRFTSSVPFGERGRPKPFNKKFNNYRPHPYQNGNFQRFPYQNGNFQGFHSHPKARNFNKPLNPAIVKKMMMVEKVAPTFNPSTD